MRVEAKSSGVHCLVVFSCVVGLSLELSAVDCNGNGLEDAGDILAGTSDDCNDNSIPDECEL